MSTTPRPVALDACPVCGVAAWSRLVSLDRSGGGDCVSCLICGLFVMDGAVITIGPVPEPEEIDQTVRHAYPGLPLNVATYVAPEDRRCRIAMVAASRPARTPGARR